MKYVLICSLTAIFILSCKAGRIETTTQETPETTIQAEQQPTLDYDSLMARIQSSSSMDMEIFFAISICQRQYIQAFETEMTGIPDSEKDTLIQQKNSEFYSLIPYSQDDFLTFFQENQAGMLDYINRHPEVAPYIMTMQ
jgi:hypothetical protein